MRSILVPKDLERLPQPVLGAFCKLSGLESLTHLYQHVALQTGRSFAEEWLETLRISYDVTSADLARVPKTGPAVVVANHPFGMLEGILLYSMLPRIRQDFQVMANALLGTLPELRSHLIPVDVFGGTSGAGANRRALTQGYRHLEAGGLLVTFPAGEVSSWDWREGCVHDPAWSRSVPWLIEKTNAPVVPLYFAGTNSVPFQLMGIMHPKLRTVRLPAEFLNKKGRRIEIRIGAPISAKDLAAIGDHATQAGYLRSRTHLIAFRHPRKAGSGAVVQPAHETELAPSRHQQSELSAEVARLPDSQKLDTLGGYDVFIARSRQIPAVLMEIGRLRERAFQLAGEGTGAVADIDSFDTYYQHLFVWHRERNEVVGAYRLTQSQPVLSRLGIPGLYTSTLFKYEEEFFKRLGPAIELGRSFVRPEYQKEYAPLLLLWRGLGAYALRHAPILFGAVSISNEYSPASRRLMVEHLKHKNEVDPLSQFVKARNPFRAPLLSGVSLRDFARIAGSLERVSAAISDMERDQRGVPVLLRQYCKLGGRVLAFHVDPKFRNALDCLILVDIRQAEPGTLRRFLARGAA